MDCRPIGMFDSGVGGLTVYKEVSKQFPNERIIYLGDTKNFPYGSKSKESIIELTKRNIEILLKYNVKIIIIACGTATSQALEEMRNIYKVPIIGIIEPAVKYIYDKKYTKIGVMATRGTIKSNAWEDNIRKYIKNAKVENRECPILAPMAEEGWTDNEIARLTIKEYLKGIGDIEALVLGCTHYPMFEKIIREEVKNIDIINTGKIIAKSLKGKIQEAEVKNSKDEILLTDTECNFKNVAKIILNSEELEIKKVVI